MSTAIQTNACGHCGGYHNGACPRIKRITYQENGMVASVEYFDPTVRDPQGWPLPTVADVAALAAAVPLKEPNA